MQRLGLGSQRSTLRQAATSTDDDGKERERVRSGIDESGPAEQKSSIGGGRDGIEGERLLRDDDESEDQSTGSLIDLRFPHRILSQRSRKESEWEREWYALGYSDESLWEDVAIVLHSNRPLPFALRRA